LLRKAVERIKGREKTKDDRFIAKLVADSFRPTVKCALFFSWSDAEIIVLLASVWNKPIRCRDQLSAELDVAVKKCRRNEGST